MVWFPGLHKYEVPVDAVRVVLLPELMDTLPDGDVVAVGNGLTVTTRPLDVAEHPLEFVIITE